MVTGTSEGTSRTAESAAASLVVAAIFIPSMIRGLYAGASAHEPQAVSGLSSAFLVVSVWAWFWSYSRRRRIAWVMDMGWFLSLGWWPVLVGYYVLKSEGRKGWGLIGVYCALYAAAWTTAIAVAVWVRVLLGR